MRINRLIKKIVLAIKEWYNEEQRMKEINSEIKIAINSGKSPNFYDYKKIKQQKINVDYIFEDNKQ